MRVVVVGAGPVGTYCSIVLARRGHHVTLVDRDPGPAADGGWNRRGVMQFHHPHFFRPQIATSFQQHAPDLWQAVLAAGCIPVLRPERRRSCRPSRPAAPRSKAPCGGRRWPSRG